MNKDVFGDIEWDGEMPCSPQLEKLREIDSETDRETDPDLDTLDESLEHLMKTLEECAEISLKLECDTKRIVKNLQLGATISSGLLAGIAGYMVTRDPTYTGYAFISGAFTVATGLSLFATLESNKNYQKTLQRQKLYKLIKEVESEDL